MSRSYSVVEIGALSFRQAEEERVLYLDASDYVDQFLKHYLRDEIFSRLAWLKEPSGLFEFAESRPDALCRIVVSRQDASGSMADLHRACMKGLKVVFVLNQTISRVLEFCLKAQYRIANRATLGSGEPGDLLLQFSDSQRIMLCLDLLQIKSAECLAVFAHDADPLYLVEST